MSDTQACCTKGWPRVTNSLQNFCILSDATDRRCLANFFAGNKQTMLHTSARTKRGRQRKGGLCMSPSDNASKSYLRLRNSLTIINLRVHSRTCTYDLFTKNQGRKIVDLSEFHKNAGTTSNSQLALGKPFSLCHKICKIRLQNNAQHPQTCILSRRYFLQSGNRLVGVLERRLDVLDGIRLFAHVDRRIYGIGY